LFGSSSRGCQDYTWRRIQKFPPMMFTDAKDIETDLVSQRDRFEQLAVQQAEELLKVAEAVYQLPEAERVAVIGYYWQRGTLADISEELGRSVPAVAGLVHRGLRRLRGQLVEVH